jgi:hypothetical protein
VAAVEAQRDDAAVQNNLCQPVIFSGSIVDVLGLTYAAMKGLVARLQEPDLMAWNEGCRLNPARGAADHLDDTRVADAIASMMTNTGLAMRNLKQHCAGVPSVN